MEALLGPIPTLDPRSEMAIAVTEAVFVLGSGVNRVFIRHFAYLKPFCCLFPVFHTLSSVTIFTLVSNGLRISSPNQFTILRTVIHAFT